MKLDLVKDAVLATLPGDVEIRDGFDDTVGKSSTSMESFAPMPPQAGPNEDRPRPPIMYMHLPFERVTLEGKVKWTFFLNTLKMTDKMVNTFVMLMQQVSVKDEVLIHGPAFIDAHLACAIWSTIKMNKCENITISSPYCLCTPAAFILTACNNRVLSEVMYFHITPPMVFAVGNHRDVATGKQAQIDIYERMYAELRAIKLITPEEYQDIITRQTSITVGGREAFERLMQNEPVIEPENPQE